MKGKCYEKCPKTLIPFLSACLVNQPNCSPFLCDVHKCVMFTNAWCSEIGLVSKDTDIWTFISAEWQRTRTEILACWGQWSFAIDIQLRQFSSPGTLWIENKALILQFNFFFSHMQFRKYTYHSWPLTKRKCFTSNWSMFLQDLKKE